MRSQQLMPCTSPRFDGFAIGWSKWRDRKSKRPRETRPLIAPDSAARKCLLPAQPCRPSGSRRRPGIHPKRLFEKELRLRLNRTRRAEKPLRESARVIRFFMVIRHSQSAVHSGTWDCEAGAGVSDDRLYARPVHHRPSTVISKPINAAILQTTSALSPDVRA